MNYLLKMKKLKKRISQRASSTRVRSRIGLPWTRWAACCLAVVLLCMAATTASATGESISPIHGVLLLGKFRSQGDMQAMSFGDQRNTLIVELVNRTRDGVAFYQGLDDNGLAGAGALLVFLREGHRRTDAELKAISAGDMRNTMIVELAAQTHLAIPALQALPDLELIHLLMGPERAYIRGVLLVGKFRTQLELNAMSGDDQRNTLIVELANRTSHSVPFYQARNDADLAGMGALLVYLRHVQSRSDAQIKSMSADDMRNTVIVEVHALTRRSDLQALTDMQLALVALGLRELPNTDNLPDYLRPGQHVLVSRVSHYYTQTSTRSFSNVPFFGLFVGRDLDCSHGGYLAGAAANGAGAAFTGVAGWGEVEGDGHPGSSDDSCVSWVSRLLLDFDIGQFIAIPQKTFNRAVLTYREQSSPACMTMVYTQGGYLVDNLPCWTGGDGARVTKANGCLILKIPNEHWAASPPGNRLVGWQDSPPVSKAGPAAWDVTQPFQLRLPGLGQPSIGDGFMLIGEIPDVANLDARDNTRCTSLLSDVQLDITYTVPPVQETYDLPPVR